MMAMFWMTVLIGVLLCIHDPAIGAGTAAVAIVLSYIWSMLAGETEK